MKVTVLSSLPPQRAITPYTMHLLGALADRADVDVEALGFSSLYPRFAYPGGAPEAGGDAWTPVPAKRTLTWYNPLSWIWAGLTVGGEVVHAQWWSWFLAPAYVVVLTLARLRGKRIVITVHNVRPHETARWKRWLNQVVIGRAHRIIVHSERNVGELADAGVDPGSISVIAMGVAVRPESGGITRADARRDLGLPPDAGVALFFGNIRPYKGVDVLLEATALARASIPDLRVIIAGELWDGCTDPRERVRSLGIESQVLTRIGYAPDAEAARMFAAADVVVLPYVNFAAQSAVGAMTLSYARPLLVSDVGGLPDLVRDERVVVPPGDPHALAGALVRVLTDDALRAKLEADARLVRAELGWGRIAEATAEIYASLAGSAPPVATQRVA